MPVYSSHKLFDEGGADAIARYLRQERRATARALMAYRSHSPIKGDQPYIPELEDDG
jgi:predicted N-acyltransferase